MFGPCFLLGIFRFMCLTESREARYYGAVCFAQNTQFYLGTLHLTLFFLYEESQS